MNVLNKVISLDSHDKSSKIDFSVFVRKYGMMVILLMMIAALYIISPTFRTAQNAINILQQISINGIIAVGMTFVIVTGGIDLTVGSMIAVASVTCGAVLTANPNNVVGAIVLSLVVCGLIGLFNGFFIAKFDMFPFVVTLASQMIARGLAYIISNGKSFVLMSPSFTLIGQGKLWDQIPVLILVFLVVTIIMGIALAKTKFGRYIYAIGGNVKAANASGVNVVSTKLITYTLMGVCVGIAGIILTSRVNAGQPSIGLGYETDAIAACVIGGTSLLGGVGTIPGTAVGIVMIGIINNGMNLLGISSYYQQVVKGFIIIGAVLLDMLVSKKRSTM